MTDNFFKISKGILLYVSKDNQELKEFIIDFDNSKAKVLLAGLSDLKIKIDTNIMPDKIRTYPDDWQCQYCQFKEICITAGKGEIKWEQFKNKISQIA